MEEQRKEKMNRRENWITEVFRLLILHTYSARREDDIFFIFSHFDLFLSNAASNSHK